MENPLVKKIYEHVLSSSHVIWGDVGKPIVPEWGKDKNYSSILKSKL